MTEAIQEAIELIHSDSRTVLRGMEANSVDLTVTSPPYFIGKAYDESCSLEGFEALHREILPMVVAATRPGGSICWQVGYHTSSNQTIPLDFVVHGIMSTIPEVRLRNRIVWRYGHGLHAIRRFSGRHEVVLWYTKGDDYHFDLDAVRVPQKYPGKRAYKGPVKGEFSGNPKGKNPEDVWDLHEDVWDIPNIKAGHIEKSKHPCQFPTALPRRLIKALCPENGVVLDPFMGSGTTAVAALVEKRRFIGVDLDLSYVEIAKSRVENARTVLPNIRPDLPVISPDPKWAVAQRPDHFHIGSDKQIKIVYDKLSADSAAE